MSRSARFAIIILVFGVACSGEVNVDGPAPPPVLSSAPSAKVTGVEAVLLPELSVSPAFLTVADPKLDGFAEWPLVFDVTNTSASDICTVTLNSEEGDSFALDATVDAGVCAAIWDGTLGETGVADPGMYEAIATIKRSGREVAMVSTSLEVVRLGLRRIQLRGEGREPLLYRAAGGDRGGFYEVPAGRVPWRLGPDASEAEGAVPLELADGAPRPLPGVWEDLTSPPMDDASSDGVEADSYNFPTAWIAGSEMEFLVTLASGIAGAADRGAPTTADVRLVAPSGLTSVGSSPRFQDGQIARYTTDESLVPNMARYDVELDWTFEVRDEATGEWAAIPGRVQTAHRFYGLVAEPTFDYTSGTHRPWVDVVDQVAAWHDGTNADADAVGGAIVAGVFNDLGLQYDRRRGASAYTRYTSRGYGDAVFDLSRFQELGLGNTINCTDAASIVSSYANMVGIDFRYHIIRHASAGGFLLNYLQGIGSADFAFSPFESGRNSFSYHAIVGGDLTTSYTVFDATAAVDGDDDPSSAPHTQLLVQGMLPNDYLAALSPEPTNLNVFQDQKVRIQ